MTTTVNYSWALPTVGASVNTWGTLVNNILTDIDAKMFAITGGAISGAIDVTGAVSAKSGNGLRAYRPDNATYGEITHGASGTGMVYNDANGDGHVWRNAGSDKMALDASGNLLIKKTALTNSSRGAYIRADNGNGGSICATGDGTTGAILFLGNEESVGAQRYVVFGNGDVQNTNNSYGAISSKKYKANIVDTSPKLPKILKIRVVNYNLIDDPEKLKQLGVIWEELYEISPGLCEETPDFEEVTLTREVEKTVPVVVKKEVTTERVQMDVIDGVAVQKVIRETTVIDEPVVDEYPVFDGDGNPVMEVVTPATGATPAVLRQKIHTVPRMETVVEKEEYTERRLTGTTTKSVKYSIFVPMLIKAMQEQQAQIEELKARVGA